MCVIALPPMGAEGLTSGAVGVPASLTCAEDNIVAVNGTAGQEIDKR
jgi:hypothetical protein